MHNITDTNKLDKMGETARTASRTGQKSAHTAMDYALRTQEVNTEILRRTSRAWIDGFRYQVKLSQGMAQVFFGQWGNALASMTPVALPVERQSRSEVTEEPAAKDAQKDIEIAEKVAKEKQRAEKQKAEKEAAKDAQKKAEKKAETQQAEKVARETRKAEEAAEETQKSTEIAAKDAQKNTETAAFPIEGYDEMNVGEVSERLNGLSVDELKRVRKYEKGNKNRGSLRKEMKQKIQTTS